MLSSKLLIFSSGCLFSVSGSRTRARNTYNSFELSLSNCSFSAPAAFPPFPGAGPEPNMQTCPFNFLFKTVHFQLRLPSLPFREPDPSQKCLHFQLTFSSKVVIVISGCLPLLFREPDTSQKLRPQGVRKLIRRPPWHRAPNFSSHARVYGRKGSGN